MSVSRDPKMKEDKTFMQKKTHRDTFRDSPKLQNPGK